MKLSIRHIIRESVAEVMDGVKLRKISVKLFSAGSSSRYGDTHKGLDTVNITPIISSSNPKIKELFSKSEMDWFELWPGHSEYMAVICAEGILRYEYDDSSDCDGVSVSESLDIDTMKDENWNLIKERIKPILDQGDIDEAIKEIGNLKKATGQYKGDKKTLKQKMSDMGVVKYYSSLMGYGGSVYFVQFADGKWGLCDYNRNKMIIPAVFDWISSGKDYKKEIKVIKGEDVFIFEFNRGVKTIKEKYKIYDVFNNYADYFEVRAKRVFNKGNISLEDMEEMVVEFFEDKMENYRGPEQKYWKEHYKEVVNHIMESLKKEEK